MRIACAALLAAAALAVSARADDMPAGFGRALDKFRHEQYADSIALLEPLRADWAKKGDGERAGVAMNYIASAQFFLGDPAKSLETARAGLELVRKADDKQFEADTQRVIARDLLSLKRGAEAEASLREAMRLDQESEKESDYAADYRRLADAQGADGDLAASLASYQGLVDLYAARHDDAREADARVGMSFVLQRLGRMEEAARQSGLGLAAKEEARHKGEKLLGAAEIDGQYNLAIQRREVADWKGEHAAWSAMLDAARRSGYKNGMAVALLNLGPLDANAGETAKARDELLEGVSIAHQDGEALNEASLMMQLGAVYANMGDYNRALETLKRARGVAVSQRDDPLEEINVLKSMLLLYSDSVLGDFKMAVRINDQMEAVARRSGRKRVRLQTEDMVGRFYEEIGDEDTASTHYQEELALARELGDRGLISDALNNGAGVLGDDRHEESVAMLEEANSIHDWFGGHVNIAGTYLRMGRPDKAAAILRPVNPWHILLGKVDLLQRDYAAARDLYAHNLKEGGGLRGVIAAQTGLGLAYEGLGDYAAAAEHFKASADLVDRQRDTLSPENRVYFLGTGDWELKHLEPYEGLVRVTEKLPGGDRESLHQAEFTRGRLFAEAAALRYGAPQTDLPKNLAARDAGFARDVATLAARAETAYRTPGGQPEYQRLAGELAKLKAQRGAFVAGLRRDYPEYAAVRYPQPIYAEETALAPNEILIEYEVTEPYSRAFVVRNGKVALAYDIGLTREQLGALVRKYRGYFEGVSDAAQLAAYDPKLGHKLYQILLAPALKVRDAAGRPLVPRDSKITIVPDEILGILPFESLVMEVPKIAQMPSGRYGPAPAGVRYVADAYDIAYEHSSTAMTIARNLKSKSAPSESLFVLADPIFNPADSRLREGAAAQASILSPELVKTMGAIGATMGLGGTRRGAADAKIVGREDFLFPRLDKTGVLARDLKDNIFQGDPAEELVGRDADKADLRKRDLSRFRYLVFATHGILDNTVPGLKEPALVLNQLGPGAETGFLTMSEVMDLKLNADVVALTACQTGLGHHLTGEGVMGLGRAFQYAGAKSVLVSLWNVAEDSTSLLAERFFFHLKEGKTKRQALRLARADVRRAGYEHPFYWAPFILIGGQG